MGCQEAEPQAASRWAAYGARLSPSTLQPAAHSHSCEGTSSSEKNKLQASAQLQAIFLLSEDLLLSMPPLDCKGGYVGVICNSCIVKYLSHVVLSNPDKKKPSSLNKDTCILVTFPYNCNIQGSQTLITTQAVL